MSESHRPSHIRRNEEETGQTGPFYRIQRHVPPSTVSPTPNVESFSIDETATAAEDGLTELVVSFQ